MSKSFPFLLHCMEEAEEYHFWISINSFYLVCILISMLYFRRLLLVSEDVQILVGQVVAQLPLLPRDEEAGVLQTERSPLHSLLPATEHAELLVGGGQAVAVLLHLLHLLHLLLHLLLLLPRPVYGVGGVVVVRVVVGLVVQRLVIVGDVPHHLVVVIRPAMVRVVRVVEGFEEPATWSLTLHCNTNK